MCLVGYHLWREQKLGRKVYLGREDLLMQSQIVFRRRSRKLVSGGSLGRGSYGKSYGDFLFIVYSLKIYSFVPW